MFIHVTIILLTTLTLTTCAVKAFFTGSLHEIRRRTFHLLTNLLPTELLHTVWLQTCTVGYFCCRLLWWFQNEDRN